MDTTHTIPAPDAAAAPASPAAGRLPDGLRLGTARLAVAVLDRSIDFYERAIGLSLLRRDGDLAVMSTDDVPVLELVEEPHAQRAGRHAGLYHVALLYPSRLELAREGARLAATRTIIEGASDHHTHEAFYLSDPDGNGLELAADRPVDQWPDPIYDTTKMDGIRPMPMDVHGLLALVEGDDVVERAEPGLRVGHLHLHVGSIAEAVRFYADVVGFDLMMDIGSAGFFAAGGYHHHLGTNTWKGEGVPPQPDGVLGLRYWTALVPAQADLDALVARLQAAGADFEVEADTGAVVARDPWNQVLRVELDPEAAR
jgi:catechol 2,3-dioxygenase